LAHAINDGTSTSKGGRGVGKCFTSREEQDQPKESIGEIKRTSELSPDVADANSMRKQQSEGDEQNEWGRFNVCCENDSNTDSQPSNQANSCTSSVSDIRKSWGDNATECWPFESRDDRQEIKCEFCGVFNGLSHKLDTNEIEGIDAKKTERRTCKILSNLQSDIEAKEIWKSFRRYEQIFSQKVLFSELYKDQHTKGFPIQTYNRSEIQEIQKKQLRILQLFREFMSSSCGWESLQQRPLELENALLFMSYNFASSTRGYCQKERKNCLYLLRKAISSSRIMSHAPCQIKEEWESFSEEEKDWHIMASIFGIWWSEWPGIERATSEKLDNLVDRLRSLGNSVVPQQVKKAFEILMGLYTKQGSDEP
jgi:hypothetical protein